MTFRVKFTDPDGTWWTAPIRNWADACLIVRSQRQLGHGADVLINERGLAEQVATYIAGSYAEQQRTGQPQLGQIATSCLCDKCYPRRTIYTVVRVPEQREPEPTEPAERPEQAASTQKLSATAPLPLPAPVYLAADDDLPRELSGPTADEVAQHTPTPAGTPAIHAITAFDVHGDGAAERSKREQPTLRVAESPASETWLDRLLRWVTGAPRGMAVHS